MNHSKKIKSVPFRGVWTCLFCLFLAVSTCFSAGSLPVNVDGTSVATVQEKVISGLEEPIEGLYSNTPYLICGFDVYLLGINPSIESKNDGGGGTSLIFTLGKEFKEDLANYDEFREKVFKIESVNEGDGYYYIKNYATGLVVSFQDGIKLVPQSGSEFEKFAFYPIQQEVQTPNFLQDISEQCHFILYNKGADASMSVGCSNDLISAPCTAYNKPNKTEDNENSQQQSGISEDDIRKRKSILEGLEWKKITDKSALFSFKRLCFSPEQMCKFEEDSCNKEIFSEGEYCSEVLEHHLIEEQSSGAEFVYDSNNQLTCLRTNHNYPLDGIYIQDPLPEEKKKGLDLFCVPGIKNGEKEQQFQIVTAREVDGYFYFIQDPDTGLVLAYDNNRIIYWTKKIGSEPELFRIDKTSPEGIDLSSVANSSSGHSKKLKINFQPDLKILYRQLSFLKNTDNYKRAIDICDQALRFTGCQGRDKSEILFFKGLNFQKLRSFEEAIKWYDAALAIPERTGSARAETLHNQGYALRQLDRCEEAIKACNAALAISERSGADRAQTLYNKGYALRQLNRYEEAIKAFDEALKIPERAGVARARTLHNQGYALGELKRYEEAIKAYDAALEIPERVGADRAETLHKKGVALGELKRYEEAIKAYDAALEIPERAGVSLAETLHNKGDALGELVCYEEAIVCYDTALAIPERVGADRAKTLHMKGHALRFLVRYEEATESYDLALKIPECSEDSRDVIVKCMILCLKKLNRYDDVIAIYDKALAIPMLTNTESSVKLFEKGNYLQELNRYQDAIICYDAALEIPECKGIFRARIFHGKGCCLQYEKRYNNAIQVYAQALSIPRYRGVERGFTLKNKGDCFQHLKQYGEAIVAYNAALDTQRTLGAYRGCILNEKGRCLVYLKRYDDAIEAYDEALDSLNCALIPIVEDRARVLNNKGAAFHNLNKYREAIEFYDAALAIEEYKGQDRDNVNKNKKLALEKLGVSNAEIRCVQEEAHLQAKFREEKAKEAEKNAEKAEKAEREKQEQFKKFEKEREEARKQHAEQMEKMQAHQARERERIKAEREDDARKLRLLDEEMKREKAEFERKPRESDESNKRKLEELERELIKLRQENESARKCVEHEKLVNEEWEKHADQLSEALLQSQREGGKSNASKLTEDVLNKLYGSSDAASGRRLKAPSESAWSESMVSTCSVPTRSGPCTLSIPSSSSAQEMGSETRANTRRSSEVNEEVREAILNSIRLYELLLNE